MSLYPQTTTYTQMPYTSQVYGTTVPPSNSPPPSYYAPTPAPQPVFHVDPNMFRRDYMTRLANLTVNSRPIIQTLSLIAQDYSRYADVVVQCIEQHIRRVPHWMKLPSFYLLDAISKNVYDPYARHFTPIVVRLFLDTYEVVDQQTRSKMEEMLLTWRTGSPTGRELFGVVSQLAIERQIWGSDVTHNVQSGNRDSGSPSFSQAQVLSELEFVLGQKERLLLTNPHDELTKHHIGILQQLRGMVQVGVPQRDLQAILTQLRTLTTSSAPPLGPVPQSYNASYPPSMSPAVAPQSYQSQLSYPMAYDRPKQEVVDFSRFLPPAVSTSSAPTVSMPDISGIFNALLKAGVVSASSNTSVDIKSNAAETTIDPERQARHAYRKLIISNKIKLTTSDVNRRRPRIAEILFDRLPTQCKQCGCRFSDSPLGKKQFEEHLDMHFRQNRKARQTVGRGHSRSWFVSLDDWVSANAADTKGKGRADGRTSSSKAVAAEEAAKREAEFRAMFVVVPPGDEAKAISCPICKELLKSEFLEDDEEWVWRNAVKKDDRIYHATCHAEAIASKSNLAVRLRNERTSRSRSKTPETRKSATPTPSKIAGTKRKAEDDHPSALKRESDGPQAKRLAT